MSENKVIEKERKGIEREKEIQKKKERKRETIMQKTEISMLID